MTKTVIHVWTQNFLELNGEKSEHYYGIGDLLRGSINIYNICNFFNYDFILDISLHPISNFFELKKHKYSNLIEENKDKIYYIDNFKVISYIKKELKKSDVVYLTSNIGITGQKEQNLLIDENLKQIIQDTLKPNNEFDTYLKNTFSELFNNDYSIIHYRLGDEYLLNEINNKEELNNEKYEKFYKHFLEKYKEDDILLSDSTGFKKYIKNKNSKIKMYDNEICHLGKSTNLDLIRNTLSELFLIINSKNIKTYSVYYWISGFVFQIGCIYNKNIEYETDMFK